MDMLVIRPLRMNINGSYYRGKVASTFTNPQMAETRNTALYDVAEARLLFHLLSSLVLSLQLRPNNNWLTPDNHITTLYCSFVYFEAVQNFTTPRLFEGRP